MDNCIRGGKKVTSDMGYEMDIGFEDLDEDEDLDENEDLDEDEDWDGHGDEGDRDATNRMGTLKKGKSKKGEKLSTLVLDIGMGMEEVVVIRLNVAEVGRNYNRTWERK